MAESPCVAVHDIVARHNVVDNLELGLLHRELDVR